MFNKIYDILAKSRKTISKAFNNLSKNKPTDDSMDLLEEVLLETDMGFEMVEDILSISKSYSRKDFIDKVKIHLLNHLSDDMSFIVDKEPIVILIVGVNGSGKTTSAAKLSNLYSKSGHNVTLIAADTYRAAAIDQLKIWSNQVDCNFIYNEETKDPSSVLFNGLESAKARKSNVVLVDTAGRLHTHGNLMEELDKMDRIIKNRFQEFKHCALITIDANLGQNSLIQAKEFGKHCKISGVILTKLDGTARGGIVFPLYNQLKIPVKFVGIGEKISDIAPFKPSDYIDGLLGKTEL